MEVSLYTYITDTTMLWHTLAKKRMRLLANIPSLARLVHREKVVALLAIYAHIVNTGHICEYSFFFLSAKTLCLPFSEKILSDEALLQCFTKLLCDTFFLASPCNTLMSPIEQYSPLPLNSAFSELMLLYLHTTI